MEVLQKQDCYYNMRWTHISCLFRSRSSCTSSSLHQTNYAQDNSKL